MYNGVLEDALSDKEISKTNMYFFKNRARPDMIVMLDSDVIGNSSDKNVAQEIKRQRDDQYAGADNVGKPLFSNGIKDVKTLNLNNNDIDLIGIRKFVDSRMSMVFGLDLRLLGINTEVGSRSEIDVVAQNMGNKTIRNFSRKIEAAMNRDWKMFVDPSWEFMFRLKDDKFVNPVAERELLIRERES